MTIMEKLLALLGPTASDPRRQATLEALVEMCKDEAQQFCHLDDYSEKLDTAVVQMVLQRYNRLNNEGIAGTNASGINETFFDGYTQDIITMLRRNRRLKLVSYDEE